MIDQVDHRVLLAKHTRKQFRERMESGELRACIIPVAATEQHLEHLAMEHDWASCLHVSSEVAKRLDPRVLVVPTMNIGISQHHMRHPGTLSATPGAWLAILLDAIQSMKQAGFANILVLNGHGGNVAPCQGIWDQFVQLTEINLQFHSYWDFLDPDVAALHLKTGRFPGHAQEFETAVALALFPENVQHEAMERQEDKEPLSATAETGTALLAAIIDSVSAHVQAMIDGSKVASIPTFH